MIDFDDNYELRYVMARNPTPASKLFIDPIETSNHLEVSPQSALIVDDVIERLNQNKCGKFNCMNACFEYKWQIIFFRMFLNL